MATLTSSSHEIIIIIIINNIQKLLTVSVNTVTMVALANNLAMCAV